MPSKMFFSTNPYVAGNPVGDSPAFIGRTDVLREVQRVLRHPEENAIILYGQRRIGKTSVLQELETKFPREGDYHPILFDLQDKAQWPLERVLRELAQKISDQLKKTAPDLGSDPETTFRDVWLPELLNNLPNNTSLVLLFDEFDVLAAPESKKAAAALFPYLRDLLPIDTKRLNFVFVIGRKVEDLTNIALSLFKNNTPTVQVSLLNYEETVKLIRLSEANNSLNWTDEAIETVWELTSGHPFLAQRLCANVWERLYDNAINESPTVISADVEAAIPDTLAASLNALEWLWEGLPPAARVVISALAGAGTKPITENELEPLLHDSGIQVVIRELKNAPLLLQDWDLIEYVEGGYRFRVELQRRWIANYKPLSRVQHELDRIEPVADSLYQAGKGFYLSGNLANALTPLREAVQLNPNHVKANQVLADIFLAQGQMSEALDLLEKFYKYQPTVARPLLIEALLALAQSNDNEKKQLKFYNRILELDTEHQKAKIKKKEILLQRQRRFAHIWTGIVVSVLGSGWIYLSVTAMATKHPIYWLLFLGALFFTLWLTRKFWFPILFYPIESVWNLLLYLAQKRQPERSVELLHQHSAFWNAYQYLPLWGLEKQLVTVYQHDPVAAKAAMNQLSTGKQSWMVQKAQIELDLQTLQKCESIADITEVSILLLFSDKLPGLVGNWLRRFGQMSQDVEAALSRQDNNHQQYAMLMAVIGYLNGLLAGEHLANGQNFGEIALKWRNIVEQYAKELLNRQEIPNPYAYGLPLNKKVHEVFAVRSDVTTHIKLLLQTRHCPPLLLYGQRRTGKTTLLVNMDTLLPSTFIMFFVDCQGPVASAPDHAGFFYNLGRAMIGAEKNYPDLTFPPLDKDALRADPFTYFDKWLDNLEQATGDKILLLALDEFVVLDQAFQNGYLQLQAILGMFRHLIQHRPRFRVLFAGTHTFADLQQWASYLINVKTVHISYLSAHDARKLIEQPIKYFSLRYSPKALQRVITVTRAHPALVQLLCGEIVLRKNLQSVNQRFKVQVDDVEEAIPNALKYGSLFFADIQHNQVDKTGTAVLRFIASKGEGTVVSQPDLQTQFATDLTETLALLEQREIIERVDDGYRFQIELVRRWFC